MIEPGKLNGYLVAIKEQLRKAELELKNLQKKVFDFAGRVIDHESEARKPAIRWNVVATDGNPPKWGRYITIRRYPYGMTVEEHSFSGKKWSSMVEVVAWISKQEMLEAGIDALNGLKKTINPTPITHSADFKEEKNEH